MSIVVVHLSDIHIKSAVDPILAEAKAIAACTYSSLPGASHLFLVVSGDIAYSGTEIEYKLAETFLREVESEIAREASCPISFIIAPGNHDCDFSRDNATRRGVIAGIANSDEPEIDGSVVQSCTIVQDSFFEFRDRFQCELLPNSDRLWYSTQFEVEGKKVILDCLNVSWVSAIHEKQGELYFPVQKYTGKQDVKSDLRLVVMHHPLNWYSQSMYRPFRMFLRDISTILFTGHEHQGNYGVVDEAESSKSAYIEGGTLQDDSKIIDSAFNIARLNLANGQFECDKFVRKNDGYVPDAGGGWTSSYDLPASATNEFEISESLQDILEDPGAFIKSAGRKKVSLSDIFIYPDLRVEDESDVESRKIVSSKIFRSVESLANGVVIQGEEKSGSSSLLYRLFVHYHDLGLVPVLIAGKDLKRADDVGVERAVKKAIKSHYRENPINKFEQYSGSKKILFIDRFDDSRLRSSSARRRIIGEFVKRFDYVVMTVGDLFEVNEMIDGEDASGVIGMDHFQLESFNYSRRTELIERWYRLDQDDTVDESEFVAKCEFAEQLMDLVMKKGVIPPLPLYLLTLLQSIEAGRSGDFKDSSLGYYYQYLLTEAFQKSRVPADKLTEVFDYVTQLAWEYHQKSSDVLSVLELRDFNTKFTAMWHTVDFESRLKLLIRARVLRKIGGDYAFRYPYVYYYLKGRYLSRNLQDLDNRAYIVHCCEHLYVRDHANTILFLAHHTNDLFVLRTISDTLASLFTNRSPVTFQNDTFGIDELVSNAPSLTYTGESPNEHRRKRSAVRDKIEPDDDGLAASEESDDELSLPAKLTVLFKTTEILGQVLKNQYSSISRTDKGDLVEGLFDAPLRALQDCYQFFERYPDSLVAEIESAIERHGDPDQIERRSRIARQAVAALILAITLTFVLKAAHAASSESLMEDVRSVVKRKGTVSYRIIELAIRLNSPSPIPRSLLENLQKNFDKDSTAQQTMRMLVINRLYMYKTSESDMQWLSEKLKLGIGVQHVMSYQRKGSKRIK